MKHLTVSDKIESQKCALYVRVSTQMQVDKDSLPLQREDLINYSRFALGVEKYEIFEDAGYSAKNTERPAFKQMMARLRTGEFSHLVVWKIDRISRNLLDFAEMYSEIKNLGITFVSKNEQFDTSNAMGEAMLKIILVFAELERQMTSERVKAVMISRANNGQWNGGRVPFGYNYDKQTSEFTINEKEAAVINLIYDTYEIEQSLLSVARMLNERGVLPRSGNAWNPNTISTILKNPFYTGVYRYNYHDESKRGNSSNAELKDKSEWIFVEDHHPAIIDERRQRYVMHILESNRRTNRRSSKKYTRKNTHIFAGLLFCGCCGSQMQSTIDRPRADGYRPSIYACSRKRRYSDCTNKYVSDITVAPFVLNYISNILKAQNNFGKSTSLDTFERKLLRGDTFSDVLKIDKHGLQDMYDMMKSGDVSDVVFSSQRVENTEQLQLLDDERNLLAAEKRKKERALSRLKSLYLYNDEAISESEYLVERKSLLDAISQIDERLDQIEEDSSKQFTLSDDEFMAKASLFIMTNQLQEKRHINFTTFIKTVDLKIIKEFLNSIIQKIVIEDGKVTTIRFKNGIEHNFLYKDAE